ncbi:MAG: hypothetical protein H0T62_01110 [Parachlamydiaceae bacterium]|nr:hypothetical protein [Parachlamydiaceae bacterium]
MEHVSFGSLPLDRWKPDDIGKGLSLSAFGAGAVAVVASAIFLGLALSGTISIPLTAVIVVGAVGVAVMLVSAIYLAVMRFCKQVESTEISQTTNFQKKIPSRNKKFNHSPLGIEGIKNYIINSYKSPQCEIRKILSTKPTNVKLIKFENVEYPVSEQFHRDMLGYNRYLINDEVSYSFSQDLEIQDTNDSNKFYADLVKTCVAHAGEEKGRLIAERISRGIVQTCSADLCGTFMVKFLDEEKKLVNPDRINDVYRIWISSNKVVIEKKELYVFREIESPMDYIDSQINTRTIKISMKELAEDNLEVRENPLPSLKVKDVQTRLSNHLPEKEEGQDYQTQEVTDKWKEILKDEFIAWYKNIETEALVAKKKQRSEIKNFSENKVDIKRGCSNSVVMKDLPERKTNISNPLSKSADVLNSNIKF